ncbi:MAG TPA: hypothetical protein VFU49_12325 [Ktedonobacteraceae bacterium]|nr:hypothetical protein [Ktedonobacteraceae bacterium]
MLGLDERTAPVIQIPELSAALQLVPQDLLGSVGPRNMLACGRLERSGMVSS